MILKYLSLFFIGSIFGFILELLFRRFFSNHKWINPGILNGPYIPLYGVGLIFLHLISNIEITAWHKDILLISIMSISMILIELITGLIFLKMHIRLWDYSKQWLNYKGLICPLFSLFWIVICIVYYYLVNPLINNYIGSVYNLSFSFLLGNMFMIFVFDVIYTYDIMSRVRAFAKEKGFIFLYDNLRFTRSKKKPFLKRGSVSTILEEYYAKINK